MQLISLKISNTNIPLSTLSLLSFEESVFKPVTYGSITLMDSIMKESIEFFAGDDIEIELRDETITKNYKLKFKITSDGVHQLLDNMEFNGVTLNFSSAFAVDMFATTLSDFWSQKKISEIVQDILYRYSVDKNIIDETINKIDFVSPMWCPANIIGYLSKISMSKTGSAGYLFFPEFISQKMNFISHESLVTEKLGKCVFDIYFVKLDPSSPSSAGTMTLEKEFDLIAYTDKGLGNSIGNYYLHNGDENINTDFTFSKFSKKTLSKKLPMKKQYEDSKYNTIFSLSYPTKQMNETFIKNRYLRNMMSQIRLNVSMAGSFERKIGQTIYVHYPSNIELKTGKDDEKYSGKYLIHSIRHEFDRTSYLQTVGLMTDGFFRTNIKGLVEF